MTSRTLFAIRYSPDYRSVPLAATGRMPTISSPRTIFAAGEMLDWEAPTGVYLLQASFATGAAAGRGVLKWLEIQAHTHKSYLIGAA
jgi:HI0933-like protein